jgi:sulfur dioxygenase
MFLRQLYDQDTYTFTYLVADTSSGHALLIDPVLGQVERDAGLIEQLGFRLIYAIDTHVHADHITGAGTLRRLTGCKIAGSKRGAACNDLKLCDGDRLALGALTVEVLETPGHTDDSLSFKIGDHVFTGDALFVRGTGRTDFQHGDAGQLYDSITRRLFTLPDYTQVWPAHDYKGHSQTTIGEEKRLNPRVSNRSREAFIELMNALKLPRPRYIDQAVPANQEGGLGLALEDAEHTFEEVSAAAIAKIDGLRIIDVREPHEFNGELGHIEGAHNVPYAEIAQAALDWRRDTPLLLVCRSGRRSRGAAQTLAARGYTRVHNLSGGMLDVQAGGHPVERD